MGLLSAWKLCWCLGAVQSQGIIHVQYPAFYGLYFHTYHSLHTENLRQTCSMHTQPCIHEYMREHSFPSKEDPFGWEVGWQGFGCRGIVRFLSFVFLFIYIYIYIERRIKFIRVGDAVRTVGQLKGEPNPFAG